MSKRFSGRVIDGPREGERMEEDWPHIKVPVTRPMSLFDYRDVIPTVVHAYIGVYHWSYSLKAWCWEAPRVTERDMGVTQRDALDRWSGALP